MPLLMQAKPIVDKMKLDLSKRTDKLKEVRWVPLNLIIFINPENEASKIYLRNKLNFGKSIGVEVKFQEYKTKLDIIKILKDTNYPFIIQEPALISQNEIDDILNQYNFRDMDCFGSFEFGLMAHKRTDKFPCTPYGIIKLLEYYHIMDQINNICILGRSKIVGSPLEILLRDYYNKTVFTCHSKTKFTTVNSLMNESQVIISAIGKNGEFWVPKDKILIDVGINRDSDNKIIGDFMRSDYENSRAYTPVPGGVGPMTVACLFENVVKYYEQLL